MFFRCILNATKMYFNEITRNTVLLIQNESIMHFFSDSTQ